MTTYENAIFSAALLRGLEGRRAAVVTCPWHMPRALRNFQDAGIEACGLPTPGGTDRLLIRAYLGCHELASGWFDRRAMRSQRVLRESAAELPRRRGGAP
jgi:uncharacterized SAM-binding protein YcdF (DUF218 family)